MVSIRSPHRSKGRHSRQRACDTTFLAGFQSAPLTEARGDTKGVHGSTINTPIRFQSAPLTEARGDTIVSTFRHRPLRVLQSAPLTEARGDTRLRLRI